MEEKKLVTGCKNGTTPTGARAAEDAAAYTCKPGYGDPPNIFVADTIGGPWRLHGLRVHTTPYMKHLDNPAPLLFPNGGAVILSRKYAKHNSTIGLVRTDDWADGTYAMPEGRLVFPRSVEDPSNIWRDKRGNLHVLFHNWVFSKPPVGAHAFSRDGISWQMSPSITYNTTVRLKGVGAYTFRRRERPHVIVDGGGVPTHLLNGVLEEGQTTGKKDRSWTLVAALDLSPPPPPPSPAPWVTLNDTNVVYTDCHALDGSTCTLYALTDSATACAAACEANATDSHHRGERACTAWTWHDATTGSWARKCVFRVDGEWEPRADKGHASGHRQQGTPVAAPAPPPVPAACQARLDAWCNCNAHCGSFPARGPMAALRGPKPAETKSEWRCYPVSELTPPPNRTWIPTPAPAHICTSNAELEAVLKQCDTPSPPPPCPPAPAPPPLPPGLSSVTRVFEGGMGGCVMYRTPSFVLAKSASHVTRAHP
jgi:hypothetical protein